MGCIAGNVRGRHFLKRPSKSPDMSPIKNLWAWMEKQLEDRSGIQDTADLQARLSAIWDSFTNKQLSKYFSSKRARMKRVIKLQWGHIGK